VVEFESEPPQPIAPPAASMNSAMAPASRILVERRMGYLSSISGINPA
jgi:hypothetical protein